MQKHRSGLEILKEDKTHAINVTSVKFNYLTKDSRNKINYLTKDSRNRINDSSNETDVSSDK